MIGYFDIFKLKMLKLIGNISDFGIFEWKILKSNGDWVDFDIFQLKILKSNGNNADLLFFKLQMFLLTPIEAFWLRNIKMIFFTLFNLEICKSNIYTFRQRKNKKIFFIGIYAFLN